MAAIPGTIPVGGPFATTDSTDTYGTHFAEYGIGGLRSVADNTARDTIPAARREEGMSVYVIATGQRWFLDGGIDNANWSLESTSSITAIPGTMTLRVDGSRTDTYTETGSDATPFKTITAAVNQVIANGDNSLTKRYSLKIADGYYPENLIFENTALVLLSLLADSAVYINPASGNSFQSTTNNSNLKGLIFTNLQFVNDFVLEGTDDGAAFNWADGAGLYAYSCTFSSLFSLTSIGGVDIQGWGAFSGSQQFVNIGICQISPAFEMTGTGLDIVRDPAKNGYAVFTNPYAILDGVACTESLHCGAGAGIQLREGSRAVNPGNTLTIDGTCINYNGVIRGNVVVNDGATFDNYNGWYDPANLTVNSGGIIAEYGQATRDITFVLGGTLAVGSAVTNAVVMDKAGVLLEAKAMVIGTAPVGASVIFTIKKNGTTITTDPNRLIIANGATAGSTSTFSLPTCAANDSFTFDINQVGSTTPGAYVVVKLTIRYNT